MKTCERVHRVSSGRCVIRMWCLSADLRDDEEYDYQHGQIWQRLKTLSAAATQPMRAPDVAEVLGKLPFCRAVEVTVGETTVVIRNSL